MLERVTRRVSFVGEALSFAYFSLGQQRKVSRSPQASESTALRLPSRKDQTLSSADAAEFISSGRRQKKQNQRKRLPDEADPASRSFRDFSTRHPGSVEKHWPSMAGAFRVCSQVRDVTQINSNSQNNRRCTCLLQYVNLSPDLA